MISQCADLELLADAERTRLLELSDERDRWERRLLAEWREGWRACAAEMADEYNSGYVDGLLARKHIGHSIVEMTRLEVARWQGPRERFGDPRPGDFPGRGAAA